MGHVSLCVTETLINIPWGLVSLLLGVRQGLAGLAVQHYPETAGGRD